MLHSKEMSQEIQDDRQEMLQRCRSDVARAWGKYSLLLLSRSMDKDIEKKELEDQLQDLENLSEKSTMLDKVDFPSIETDPSLNEIPEKYATNFEEARAIFLPGQKFLNFAKNEYYKFEEHCVDYVEIQRDLSHMHKVLVYFEPDISRKFKIQKRRIDLLQPTYKELNPQLFTLLVKQLIYEVAETFSAMMDLKLDTSNEINLENAKKINRLVDSSIGSFQDYLKILNDKDDRIPETYKEEDVRPALVAYFHLARLFDKYKFLPEDPNQRLRNKIQTYTCYKHVVDYCR